MTSMQFVQEIELNGIFSSCLSGCFFLDYSEQFWFLLTCTSTIMLSFRIFFSIERSCNLSRSFWNILRIFQESLTAEPHFLTKLYFAVVWPTFSGVPLNETEVVQNSFFYIFFSIFDFCFYFHQLWILKSELLFFFLFSIQSIFYRHLLEFL